MPNANSITVVGHLTRNPELRFTPKGVPITSFGIAVNEKRGENQEAHFFDVTCWYDVAEEVAGQLQKGDCAVVVGKLRFESWDDKETGKKRSRVSINASVVGIALWRAKEGETTRQRQTAPESATGQPARPAGGAVESDDVPF